MSKSTAFAALYASLYAGFATLWIFGSDSLVGRVAESVPEATGLELAKGCAFVAVTALVLFLLMRRFAARLLAQDLRLAEGERQYRFLFEANPQPMWVYDRHSLAFLAVNDAAVIHYGYGREEFLGMTVKDIHAGEDVPRLLEHLLGLRRDLWRSGCWRHLKKDGTLIEVDITSHPLLFGGQEARVAVVRDVTGQRAAEAALRASEELQRAVLDSILATLAVLDREGKIQAVNQAWRRFAQENGAVPGRVDIGGDYLAVCRAATGAEAGTAMAAHDGIRDVLAGRRESFTLEYPCRVAGREDWFLLSVTPLGTALGGGAVLAHMDISERKRMEDALHESEERFRAVVEDQTEVIARFAEDGTITFVNEVYCRFFGKSGQELLGRKWQPLAVAEDVPDIIAKLRELSPANPVVRIENRVYSGRGDIHWMQFINRGLFDAEGRLTAIQSVGRDITELKQAGRELGEAFALLDTLFATAPIGLAFVGTDLRWLRINDWLARIDGVPVAGHIGRRPREVLPLALAGRVEGYFQRVIASGQPILDLEFHSETPDSPGVLRHWLASYFPVLAVDGRLLGVGAMVQDITERVRAAAERELLQRQLQQAQKMEAIGQLTGGVAHDFNNILASILGYTDLALERYVTDPHGKLAEYLGQVRTAGERARDLIAKMLAFSRGNTAAEFLPLTPGPLVGEVALMLASAIPSNIELSTRLDPAAPPILIDPVDLHQVLTNLAINARDAIPGAGRIEIGLYGGIWADALCTACHRQVRGEFVELSVGDTGSGIAAENLPRIFDPFFTTKAVGKGSGVGLSVVLGIVHRAGGHVLVETQPGVGTTFRLLFPAAAGMPVAAGLPSMPSASRAKRLRVLVVDDEPPLARLWGDMLEVHGHGVQVFTDSRAALAHFEAAPTAFDVVITDQTMPGLTGLELAGAMLRRRSDLTVVLCTGYSDQVDAEEATRRGIRHFFKKPVRPAELLAALAEAFPE